MSAVTETIVAEAPVAAAPPVAEIPKSPGVWAEAWTRLKRDRVGMVCLWIVAAFMVMVLLAQFGVIASKDSLTVEQFYRLENQSEEKVYNLRELGAAAARRLLGS